VTTVTVRAKRSSGSVARREVMWEDRTARRAARVGMDEVQEGVDGVGRGGAEAGMVLRRSVASVGTLCG
jgi:hypothetical protein